MRGQLGRLVPLTGVVFAGLIVAAIVASPSTPNSDASTAKVVSFYTAHRKGELASAFLIWYAALFLIFFAAVVRSHLRARSDLDGLIALGFAGAALLALAFAILGGLLYSAADVPGKISPAAEQALNVLQDDVFPIIFVTTAAFMLGTGLTIARSKALPKWLGWIAILTAAVSVVPPLSFIGLFILLGWSALVGVLISLGQGKAAIP